MDSGNESGPVFETCLETTIDADAASAYRALTDPALLSIWFTTKAEADLRPGGRYANADGDAGAFLVLSPPARLAFTWENPKHCPGTRVDVRLVDLSRGEGKEVRVELVHSGLRSENDVADMSGGWSWALDSLKSYLETGRPIPHEEWLAARGKAKP